MTTTLDLPSLSWRSLRGSLYATQGSMIVHRYGLPGQDVYVFSNAAWMPGEPPVVTQSVTCPQFPVLPPIFPPRFQWVSDPAREGDAHAHGFHSFLSPDNPGDVGGAFVELHPPAGLCTPGYVYTWMDRSPIAAFHRGTGKPLTRRDIGTGFEYRLDRGGDQIQNLWMFQRGQDPADLQSWEAPDQYHLERTYMRALGLWRETKNAVARHHILMVAADVMLSYQLAIIPMTSAWRPFSLGRMVQDAQLGKGGSIVRGIAWVLRCLVAALEVGAPNRDEIIVTIGAILHYWQIVVMQCGALYDAHFGASLDNDEPVYVYGLDTRFGWCPSWQVPFAVRAIWEVQHQLPDQRRRCIGLLAQIKKLWGPSTPRVPVEYNLPGEGIPLYLVTSENNVPVQEITMGVGLARPYADPDSFACFAEAGL